MPQTDSEREFAAERVSRDRSQVWPLLCVIPAFEMRHDFSDEEGLEFTQVLSASSALQQDVSAGHEHQHRLNPPLRDQIVEDAIH
jgi:hypothetical protein